VKTSKHARLSTNEKRRRQVIDSLRNPSQPIKQLEQLYAPITNADLHFIGGNTEVEIEYQKDQQCYWKGSIALALSRRHWSEQYLILTKDVLLLIRHRESKDVTISINVMDILAVRAMPQDLCPIASLGFLEIETHTRVLTIMVRSDMQLNGWMGAFVTLGIMASTEETQQVRMLSSSNQSAYLVKEMEDVFIARPACWKTDKRRVYNYRRIIFKSSLISTLSNHFQQEINPNDLIESILTTIFFLCQSDHTRANDREWVKFWDDISLLQTIKLIGLTETQRLAFFLNLYHVMVLHACLMFGPPPAWNHWNAFFNNISYVVSFELVSIAELEYCILR
jgi:hypothetical protein